MVEGSVLGSLIVVEKEVSGSLVVMEKEVEGVLWSWENGLGEPCGSGRGSSL